MSQQTAKIGYIGPTKLHIGGNVVDISALVVSIEVTESIFSPFVMGKIVVQDVESVRVVKDAKLRSGLEAKVELSFAGLEDDGITVQKPITISPNDFYIYKVSVGTPIGAGVQGLELFFAHRLFFLNQSSNFSRSYKQQPISQIVADITKNYLTGELADNETSDGKLSVVLPYGNALQHINFLSPMARRKSNPNDVNYIFFQTLDGKHHFTSLGKLYEQKSSFGQSVDDGYVYGINRGADFKSARRAVLSHRSSELCQFDNACNGMHSSALLTVDPIKKLWAMTTFHLPEVWNKQTHLSAKPVVPPDSGFYDVVNGAFIQRYYQKARHTNCCKEKKGGQDQIGGENDWLLKRISAMEQANQYFVEFTVTGNSDSDKIGAGKIIYFGRPGINNAFFANNTGEKDLMFSGKYLVSTVTHRVLPSLKGQIQYQTIFRCAKDSVGDE